MLSPVPVAIDGTEHRASATPLTQTTTKTEYNYNVDSAYGEIPRLPKLLARRSNRLSGSVISGRGANATKVPGCSGLTAGWKRCAAEGGGYHCQPNGWSATRAFNGGLGYNTAAYGGSPVVELCTSRHALPA